jgi:hypothetical protein
MPQDATRLINLLSQRLRALQSLVAEVSAGQEACIALDVEKLQMHDEEKRRLCTEIGRLEKEIAAFRDSAIYQEALKPLATASEDSGTATGPETLQHIRKILRDSALARAEAARRNNAYAAFLRRARANINMMTNVLSHCLGVYPPWVFPASAGSLWERGY